MTAEMTGAVPWPDPGSRGVRRGVRPVVGVLADGTPYYAPLGEIVSDGTTVTCHLCGRPLKSVAAHLRTHGWTKAAYCEAFGLERGQPLEGQETRKRRAASFAPRLVFDPAIRAGSAAGRQRAATGELSQDAARASTGRPLPEQRRRKASRAAAAASSEVAARANRDRAARHRAEVAARIASDQGYPTLGAYVLARVASGASLAAISREAGLHKDWLHRHLAEVDPAVAAAVRPRPADRDGPRWLQAVTVLGFADVSSYLRDRHLVRHRTVSAIGAEIGMSNHAVAAALTRHGLARTAHAGKRKAARERAAQVAAVLGVDSVPRYVAERRAAGWTWQAIAAECDQPPSWLRRQGALSGACPRPGPRVFLPRVTVTRGRGPVYWRRRRRRIRTTASTDSSAPAGAAIRLSTGRPATLSRFSESSLWAGTAAGVVLARTLEAAAAPLELAAAGTAGSGPARSAGESFPAVSMSARLVAKMPISLALTSAITPRPNWAGRPVTFSEVCTVTSVWPSWPCSSERTVAAAVPEPRVSLPAASKVTTPASRFRSVNRAVPA
jgi:hypothetical protein